MGSVPGLGRCPGEGNGNPLQYSNLGNPMDRGAQWAAVHGVAKSWTQHSTHLGITHMKPALIFPPIFFFKYWYRSCFLWERSWFLLESPGIFCDLLLPPFACIPKIYTLTPVSTLLQYSCLENPMDGGAWWAAVHGVAKSQTWLKQLSNSSSSIQGLKAIP